MIPYGRQNIIEQDIEAVGAVLRSDFLTQGEVLPAFEERVAAWCGVRYGVAVNSATSALHVACLALGIKPGDRVWTSPNSFVASSNCALYCGASVDFVDIEPATYNMSMDALAEKLEEAERSDALPALVIPVHFCGQSCEMEKLGALARRYGFKVLEDASHAIGASYQGGRVGDCRYSDIAVFSFHPVKIVTTAEGGLATTNNPELAQRMQLFRSHGVTRDETLMTGESHGPWYYQQVELGYNYRMTELQGALGLSQMDRLETFVTVRNRLAERYDAMLSSLPLTTPARRADTRSSFHLYVIRLKLDEIQASHRDVFTSMRAAGIGVNLHYIPIYLQPYYARMGFASGHCPEAERYYAEAISIPMYPDLTDGQQEAVVGALASAVGR